LEGRKKESKKGRYVVEEKNQNRVKAGKGVHTLAKKVLIARCIRMASICQETRVRYFNSFKIQLNIY
jgi:hypothetical protein